MKNLKLTLFITVALFFPTAINLQAQCTEDCCRKHPEVKNIIYMIGDGMGVPHVTQLIIEENLEKIEMERAQAVGLVRTFSANNRVTDSAAAGTALATGTKTGNSILGIDMEGNQLKSVMAHSAELGMQTGFVVTCQVAHATPAAFYAHIDDRRKYPEIAEQLVESGIDVFIGGGRNDFIARTDGRDLTVPLREKGYQVEFDFENIRNINSGKVAGILSDKYGLPYYVDGRGDYLPEATAKAIEILENNDTDGKGFFLMVEGSLIDYAAHDHMVEHLIGETRDFDKAVGVAFDYADANPGTLVVVLADHETGGLSIPSNNADFIQSESGIDYRFSTDGHSASLIAMFAYGTGAHHFTGVFDNTEIPLLMKKLLGIE